MSNTRTAPCPREMRHEIKRDLATRLMQRAMDLRSIAKGFEEIGEVHLGADVHALADQTLLHARAAAEG